MSKKITLPFGTVTLYSQYMIVVIDEGITVTLESNSILRNLVQTYYKNKNVVYISYRLNSYAIDPNIYIKTSQISNLLGVAVVTGKEIHFDSTPIERLFYKKPFKTFESLDNAIIWAKELCATQESHID